MSAPTLVSAVATPDGTLLNTEVYLPAGDGPFPAELLRTPYGPADRADDAARMVRDGVAVVVQSCRGRFGSGGAFDLGLADAADGPSAVAWIRQQPWSDGRVALWGFSYGAYTQWQTVGSGIEVGPSCPSMGPPPWRGLDFRRGGAIELAALAHWLPRQAAHGAIASPPTQAAEVFARAFEPDSVLAADEQIDLAAALDHPTLNHHPLTDPWPVGGRGEYGRLWQSVFSSPGNGLPSRATRRLPIGPALVVGGWYDLWSTEQTEAWRWVRANSSPTHQADHRLIMAPAGHGFHPLTGIDVGPTADRFGLDLDHRWAVEWLQDDPGELRSLAPVTWFLIGANGWRSATDWPPPSAHARQWSLGADGCLSDTVAVAGESRLPCDPRSPVPTRGGSGMLLPPGPWEQAGLSGDDRDDVVSFVTEPLNRDLDIAGPVRLDVTGSADVPDFDLAAKLVDVSPSGVAMSVCDGIARARWRAGNRPALVQPGEAVSLTVQLGTVGYRVRRGHRLRVDVAGTNFPRYLPNAHTGAPEGSDLAHEVRPAIIIIHHGPRHYPVLSVHVLSGESE
ncbi:MAG: CocE/NonD family hydrolase [Acidimicrobiales bacterium]